MKLRLLHLLALAPEKNQRNAVPAQIAIVAILAVYIPAWIVL